MLAVDCLGPVSETLRGNKHVIVAIDCFTRFVVARAVQEITAAEFVDFLLDYCVIFGVPQRLITDNASTFCNSLVKEINTVFGIKHLTATPYHSRGNSMA